MWPIQFAFRLHISCRIFLCYLTFKIYRIIILPLMNPSAFCILMEVNTRGCANRSDSVLCTLFRTKCLDTGVSRIINWPGQTTLQGSERCLFGIRLSKDGLSLVELRLRGLDPAENDERVLLRVGRGTFMRGYWKRRQKNWDNGTKSTYHDSLSMS